MQFLNLASGLALLASAASIIAVTLPDDSSLHTVNKLPYKVAALQFNGTINGIPHVGSGSLNEIYAQFSKLHPEAAPGLDAFNITSVDSLPATPKRLLTRNKSALNCCPIGGWGWQYASGLGITAGILQMEQIGGVFGLGGHLCGRIACNNGASIWMCNDNNYYIQPSMVYLASYAADILGQCDGGGWTGCGQEFDTDNYNVIVHTDDC